MDLITHCNRNTREIKDYGLKKGGRNMSTLTGKAARFLLEFYPFTEIYLQDCDSGAKYMTTVQTCFGGFRVQHPTCIARYYFQ